MRNRLREIRFFARKSQPKLWLETGIHYSTISRIECGYVEPTKDQMRKLAKALGVSVKKLFPSGERKQAKDKAPSEIENERRSSVNKI